MDHSDTVRPYQNSKRWLYNLIFVISNKAWFDLNNNNLWSSSFVHAIVNDTKYAARFHGENAA